MDATKLKILVLNPSLKIDEIIAKANVQHSKNGPFETIILLDAPAVSEANFDQQTYFYNSKPKPIGPNLNGINGVVKLPTGISIFFCGDEVLETNGTVDILVTKSLPIVYDSNGNYNVDKMIKQLKPRYIFCCGEFKEYPPFQWENGTVTRLLSLHQEGRGKWFYAFNISKLVTEIDSNSLVPNPFIDNTKKRANDDPPNVKLKKQKVITPQECFFCLSNPNVETHMIVTIEKFCYLTIARGPLTRYNKEIPFAGHGIIIPIEHMSTIDVNSPTFQEINDLEIRLYHKFNEKYPDFVLVVFDINLTTNIHYHKQLLPIHRRFLMGHKFETILDQRVKVNNEKYTNNHKLDFKKNGDIDITNKQYMMFKVYNDIKPVTYVSILEQGNSIDLQFPRRVLCSVLNNPKRLYWDKCKQGKHQEMRECEEFKQLLL